MTPFDFRDKKHLTVAAIILLLFIPTFIFGLWVMNNRDDNETKQREWYSRQLRYEFGTIADTIINLKQKWGYGEIYFTDDQGQINMAIEDSLNDISSDKIRFIMRAYDGRLKFVIQNSHEYLTGDSFVRELQKESYFDFQKRNTHIHTSNQSVADGCMV